MTPSKVLLLTKTLKLVVGGIKRQFPVLNTNLSETYIQIQNPPIFVRSLTLVHDIWFAVFYYEVECMANSQTLFRNVWCALLSLNAHGSFFIRKRSPKSHSNPIRCSFDGARFGKSAINFSQVSESRATRALNKKNNSWTVVEIPGIPFQNLMRWGENMQIVSL